MGDNDELQKHKLLLLKTLKNYCGAAEGTRTPDPIITNDVLYHLSYSGFWDPTMALLVLLLRLELIGFASHSRGDPLITNDVLYQLSYSGPCPPGLSMVPGGQCCRANDPAWVYDRPSMA